MLSADPDVANGNMTTKLIRQESEEDTYTLPSETVVGSQSSAIDSVTRENPYKCPRMTCLHRVIQWYLLVLLQKTLDAGGKFNYILAYIQRFYRFWTEKVITLYNISSPDCSSEPGFYAVSGTNRTSFI